MSSKSTHNSGLVVSALYLIGIIFLIVALLSMFAGSSIVGGLGIMYSLLIAAGSIPFFFFGQVLDNLKRHTELLEEISNKLSR
jgi:hypothetical protein